MEDNLYCTIERNGDFLYSYTVMLYEKGTRFYIALNIAITAKGAKRRAMRMIAKERYRRSLAHDIVIVK